MFDAGRSHDSSSSGTYPTAPTPAVRRSQHSWVLLGASRAVPGCRRSPTPGTRQQARRGAAPARLPGWGMGWAVPQKRLFECTCPGVSGNVGRPPSFASAGDGWPRPRAQGE